MGCSHVCGVLIKIWLRFNINIEFQRANLRFALTLLGFPYVKKLKYTYSICKQGKFKGFLEPQSH